MTRSYTPATLANDTTPGCFTVASLAVHWGCSEALIRNMIRRGELLRFKLGTLDRIPRAEVERIECQTIQNLPCSGSEAGSQLSGETRQGSVTVNRSSQPTGSARRQRPGNGGGLATIVNGPWMR